MTSQGTHRIKDVADRSGFSAATLRYYEDIGLLPPPSRTTAGYRVYDDDTIDRLAFVARAKQLGCSLDEIAQLSHAWDAGRCGPLQDQLRLLVAEKLTAARRQIDDLTRLAAELEMAMDGLDRHRPAGPCDDDCGCLVDPAMAAPVRLGRFGGTA